MQLQANQTDSKAFDCHVKKTAGHFRSHSVCTAFCGLGSREVDRPPRHDGGNGVLVDHLRNGIAKQNHVLVEGFDLSLQFDAVDQIDRNGYVLTPQGVEERVLQKLAFVAHDMFRVQE